MMLHFVKHSDINPEKWDTLVLKSSSSSIFLTYECLNLLTLPNSWNAIISDDYSIALPLPTRRKWTKNYAYTPFFIPQMGILSSQNINPETIELILEAIPDDYVLADIVLNAECECVNNQKDFEFTSYKLGLNHSYDSLYANFSTNTKRNIRHAEKQNFQLFLNENIVDETIELFRKNRGALKNVNFLNEDYKRLAQVAKYLHSKNLCEIYGVKSNIGELVAAAFFVRDFRCTWFWFSGRDNATAGAPMFFLMDNFVKNNANTDNVLDFNGSNNKNVSRLYAGFGGVRYNFYGIRRFRSPFWKLVFKLRAKIKRRGSSR